MRQMAIAQTFEVLEVFLRGGPQIGIAHQGTLFIEFYIQRLGNCSLFQSYTCQTNLLTIS